MDSYGALWSLTGEPYWALQIPLTVFRTLRALLSPLVPYGAVLVSPIRAYGPLLLSFKPFEPY